MAAGSDEFGKVLQESEARGRGGVFDLRKAREFGAFVPENSCEAADAVHFGVGKIHPLGFGGAGRNAAETDSDKFA